MGCAGRYGVPGGDDTVNIKYFASPDDMKARVEGLEPGMTEQQVFMQLGKGPEMLHRLSRPELVTALYGSNALQISADPYQQAALEAYLNRLNGYTLTYKDTSRSHGFVNPLRVRTDERGYEFDVPIIFLDGRLKEKPVLSGGPVHEAHSQTIFDILTPAKVIDRAIP